jgi:hypothetical protein
MVYGEAMRPSTLIPFLMQSSYYHITIGTKNPMFTTEALFGSAKTDKKN